MVLRILAPAAALVAAGVAFAQAPPSGAAWAPPPSLHNIAWYSAHAAERVAILRFCQSDHRFDATPDCANAQSAERAAYAERLRLQAQAMGNPRSRTSPSYWLQNNSARWTAVAACSVAPDPGFTRQYSNAECAAARQADAMAPPNLRTHFAPWQ